MENNNNNNNNGRKRPEPPNDDQYSTAPPQKRVPVVVNPYLSARKKNGGTAASESGGNNDNRNATSTLTQNHRQTTQQNALAAGRVIPAPGPPQRQQTTKNQPKGASTNPYLKKPSGASRIADPSNNNNRVSDPSQPTLPSRRLTSSLADTFGPHGITNSCGLGKLKILDNPYSKPYDASLKITAIKSQTAQPPSLQQRQQIKSQQDLITTVKEEMNTTHAPKRLPASTTNLALENHSARITNQGNNQNKATTAAAQNNAPSQSNAASRNVATGKIPTPNQQNHVTQVFDKSTNESKTIPNAVTAPRLSKNYNVGNNFNPNTQKAPLNITQLAGGVRPDDSVPYQEGTKNNDNKGGNISTPQQATSSTTRKMKIQEENPTQPNEIPPKIPTINPYHDKTASQAIGNCQKNRNGEKQNQTNIQPQPNKFASKTGNESATVINTQQQPQTTQLQQPPNLIHMTNSTTKSNSSAPVAMQNNLSNNGQVPAGNNKEAMAPHGIDKKFGKMTAQEQQGMPTVGNISSTNSTFDSPNATNQNVLRAQNLVRRYESKAPSTNGERAEAKIAETKTKTKMTHRGESQPLDSASPASFSAIGDRKQVVADARKKFNTTTPLSAPAATASIRPVSWKNNIQSDHIQRSGRATQPNQNIASAAASAKATTTTNGTSTSPEHESLRLPPPLNFSPHNVKPVQDEMRQVLVRNAKLSDKLQNGWTLYSHQKRAVLKGLVMRRVILALDMGLGKTLIACVWMRAFTNTFPGLQAFVICPVSLKKDWKRTAETATGLVVKEDGIKTSKKKNAVEPTPDMVIFSWAKVPQRPPADLRHFVVVCDEAHSMQSLQAARTKDVLNLVGDQRCVGVLLLTGTPMKNGKPSNLFPLLKAVRHPFGNHQKAYEKHFCAGQHRSFGRNRPPIWDASGSSNLNQLNLVVSSHLLHLTKEQCLKDLPPMQRQTRHVPVSSRCQLKYVKELQGLATIYNDPNLDRNSEAVLGAVQRLRVVCASAKVGATVEVAKQILQQEPALVIFSSFAQVAKSVHSALASAGWEGELLTGDTPPKQRQGLVDSFQAGLSPVFVCTFGAGGVGLTLTAAHTIVLIDRPWTPGETWQAEDRCRRIGQTKPVKSIWMSAFELDKEIDLMLIQKTKNTDAVLVDGSNSTGGSSTSISIPRLLTTLLSKVSS